LYEHKREKLLPRAAFVLRLAGHALVALAILVAALVLGVLGYHRTEGLSWIDALLNASMILGGMGPVDVLRTTGAKLFASFYALFSGVLFLVVAGVLLAPVVHRFLHRFHLESSDNGTADRA
jgi:hypothetical protein